MKAKTVIFLSMLLFIQIRGGAAVPAGRAAGETDEAAEEDLEIIQNLDLLEHLDLFQEDLALLADYEDVDQPESMGEGDE